MSNKKLNGSTQPMPKAECTFQVLDDEGSPFDERILNESTLAALHEDVSKRKRYQSVKALLQDLA